MRHLIRILLILTLAILPRVVLAQNEPPPECKAHCDCAQGSFCYYGKCLTDPKTPVYCCAKEGCQPGRWCFEPNGGKGNCAESETYACESACDCGPVHACLEKPGGGGKVCVKDLDDPWNPGGTAVFGLTVPDGEPTYCCADPICHAGRYAYGENKAAFSCFDPVLGAADNYCAGKPCRTACDCDPGQSCLDTKADDPPPVGTSCRVAGGNCISHAVIEAVYGFSPAALIPCCGKGCFAGQKCEFGWEPGGAYTVQRVVGTCGSCDNPGEGCTCGDGLCLTTEMWSECSADCGTCGDDHCDRRESPKTCPSDCRVLCGDGSCDPTEVSSCPADCPCADSSLNWDTPVMCGDGACQKQGLIPEDKCNCPQDCGAAPDSDEDGTSDCLDGCPADPLKIAPGICGCGQEDGDSDHEGLADCVDNCPAVSNPQQEDGDRDGQGDACDADDDNDGVLDAADACPGTPAAAVVDPRGCSIAQQCPCAGPGRPWQNQGAYVSCVSRAAEALLALGRITSTEKDGIVKAATRSSCGR